MKKILGLDLGVASIGWAFIHEDESNAENNKIIATGVRVIPLDTDSEKDEFVKGGSVGTNVARRTLRGARRNLQRYRLRRELLFSTLKNLGMYPGDDLFNLPPSELFALREKALYAALTPEELGRVLLHLNTRRGFKSTRKGEDKSESEYKEAIKARENILEARHETIGQYFAKNFATDKNFRVKQEIFNRSTYQEEFDLIWAAQRQFNPTLLTESNRRNIRDKIIYYQRPLKSQKGLVGECALEWNYAIDKQTQEIVTRPNGQNKIVRPKCAPKSSPLAQECRIWENIHNIRITDETGTNYPLSVEEKRQIFFILQQKKELSATALLKELKLSPTKYTTDALIREKKLQGNHTRIKLLEVFQQNGIQRRDLLEFSPKKETVVAVNYEHGNQFDREQLTADFDQEPLYQLWHLIYATEETSDLIQILEKRYGFTAEQASNIAQIDFSSSGYTNKSSRAMRRLLPHLQNNCDYTEACRLAGYNHSNSITTEENNSRVLLKKLEILPKNALRNPVVEKILNQMIHLVNNILQNPEMGPPDETRVELARELKQSAKERKKVFTNNSKRERERGLIRAKIAEMLHIQPESVTKVQIEKWQLWHEVNGISLYSGKKTLLSDFLNGNGVDVEHIIPKSRCFDDSFENKTICETKFNQDKDKQTARDFMENQAVAGLQSYDAFLRRINDLERMGKNGGTEGEGISRAKYNRLMMAASDIPSDFISRQLRETQYITQKAKDLLADVCRNVFTTSGSITDFLRHQWGWDEVIEASRIPQFREAGRTKTILIKSGKQEKEVIPDWHKRLDHRHHALDALTVACTKQTFVQQLNLLNQTYDQLKGENRRDALRAHGQKSIANDKNAPFTKTTVQNAIEHVLISFRQGYNTASPSKNKAVNQKTLTPRGALHEETIYGRNKYYKTVDLNARFNLKWLDEMVHPHQKALVEARLQEFNNDPKRAFKDLKNKPIVYGKTQDKKLKKVTIWAYAYVSRKTVDISLSEGQIDRIIDPVIKSAILERLAQGGSKTKDAFKNIGENPLVARGPFPIKKVRITNPAEKMIQLPRGFVEPGKNHHIAIYIDREGKKQEHVVTFWEAFQRIKLGLPAIIKEVDAVYSLIEQSGENAFPDSLFIPEIDWVFVTSLQINDMFVFGIDPAELDFTDPKNAPIISKKLFKVQRLSSQQYWFCHHLETQFSIKPDAKITGQSKWCGLSSFNGVKVYMNRLGRIERIIS